MMRILGEIWQNFAANQSINTNHLTFELKGSSNILKDKLYASLFVNQILYLS
jgi:hypothetical protein